LCESSKPYWFIFWLLVFYLALVCIIKPARAAGNYTISESDMIRLSQICARLETLNQQLLNDLETSKNSLKQARQELESYKNELESLRAELKSLSEQLQESLIQSQMLQQELLRARSFLENSERSFEAYRVKAEKEIKKLKMQRNLAFIGFLLALIF
jgi:chromosome segregation ATPase